MSEVQELKAKLLRLERIVKALLLAFWMFVAADLVGLSGALTDRIVLSFMALCIAIAVLLSARSQRRSAIVDQAPTSAGRDQSGTSMKIRVIPVLYTAVLILTTAECFALTGDRYAGDMWVLTVAGGFLAPSWQKI